MSHFLSLFVAALAPLGAPAEDPASPAQLFASATAELEAGELDAALARLAQIASLGILFTPEKLPAHEELARHAGYAALVEQLARNAAPVLRSQVAFRLEDPDLLLESLAYDEKSGDFYLSSVHRGVILRRTRAGALSEFVAREPDAELRARQGPWGFLGLAIDQKNGRLYAASCGLEQVADLTDAEHGRAALLGYDLESGALRTRHVFEAREGGLGLGDVALDALGDVFLSCGDGRVLHGSATAEGAFEARALLAQPAFRSPQGMATSVYGRYLYVADWSRGLYRVDLAAGRSQRQPVAMAAPAGAHLYGIDGLLRHGPNLIAIQNAYRPHRVVRLRLNEPGTEVVALEVLEANHPEHDEPTCGTIVGDELYYVANSQWPAFDPKLAEVPTRKPPVVLKLALAP